MLEYKIQLLVEQAKAIMQKTHDPIHDVEHAKRVAEHAEMLGSQMPLSDSQRDALVLAAWWHDASRVITRRPSFIIMPFFDDLLSAFMLWFATIRYGLFGSVAGMATRLIFCKSMGTGKILTRVLLRKQNRILLDILKDADALDALRVDRIRKMLPYIQSSRAYHLGYKIMTWWMLSSKHLKLKTAVARTYLEKIVKEFLAWLHEQPVYQWFAEEFGHAWLEKNIARAQLFLHQLHAHNQRRSYVHTFRSST